MPDYLLRELPDLTLADLHEKFSTRKITSSLVNAEEIRFVTDTQQEVRFKAEGSQVEQAVPLAELTLTNFATLLGIPLPFLRNLGEKAPDLQGELLNRYIRDKGGRIWLDCDEHSVQEIRGLNMERMDPRGVIDAAIHVMGEESPVINAWRSIDQYRFDVVVHDGSSFGVGGDAKVGDLTKGGLRFEHVTKRRRAPQVSAFLYRLVCTNGMEVADLVEPLDLRTGDFAALLAQLQDNAATLLDHLDHQIESFYELRNQRVDDAAQMLTRLQRERGFSDRLLTEMISRLPALIDDLDNPTMFDVVNVITNIANHPDVGEGGRRGLELAGGHIIGEHAHRCPTCQSALV